MQKKCIDSLFGNLEFQNQDVSRAMFPLAFLRCDNIHFVSFRYISDDLIYMYSAK